MHAKLLLPVLLALFLAGCGEEAPRPDVGREKDRLTKATSLRSLFDKAGGDYARLSSSDRQEFVQLHDGDEARARRAWETMRQGATGAAPTDRK